MKPRHFLILLLGFGVFLLSLILYRVYDQSGHFVSQAKVEFLEGDPDRGREALIAYGCGSCHVIPGIPEASGQVGPSLEALNERTFIAGRLPNLPRNLVRWIQDPKAHRVETAMPDLDLSSQEAEDIAAYLYR